jgi:hypothetical protein
MDGRIFSPSVRKQRQPGGGCVSVWPELPERAISSRSLLEQNSLRESPFKGVSFAFSF